MEGGSPFVQYLTYGMIAVVLCALGFLAFRTAWFFLSLLVIPLGEAASRWAPAARLATRWGERGARRDPTSWRHDAIGAAQTEQAPRLPPRAVRRGMAIGAALGALPGVWLGVRGALRTHASGGSALEIAAAMGIALGLVAAAGALVGGAAGAAGGAAWDAIAAARADGSNAGQ